ncbi:MinD/ParA family protein [Mycolicibacterium llatzerense]|uniref:MinD/ParA family ATP-binding protein n=1 Tax=Mycolicibacterium llatzerense TaxID=280871 RepID=UPI000A55C4C0|nr:MinD/ParA family protein [Mycolicibacterium llatzerense]
MSEHPSSDPEGRPTPPQAPTDGPGTTPAGPGSVLGPDLAAIFNAVPQPAPTGPATNDDAAIPMFGGPQPSAAGTPGADAPGADPSWGAPAAPPAGPAPESARPAEPAATPVLRPEVAEAAQRGWVTPMPPSMPTPGGTHRRSPTDGPADEPTSIVDRAVLEQQLAEFRRGGQPPRPDGINGPTEQLGTNQFRAAGPTAPGGFTGRPGPAWQQPGTPPPAPGWAQPGFSGPDQRPGTDPGQPDWHGAQGSSASWNYVDNIRSSEMVPTRRIPPRRGWRKGLYLSTFKLINPGQSPDERYQAELETKIRSLLRGRYKIGVLGKGGVGKSTVSACVGSIFAELRQDDRVVAVDADTAFGKLASRIDPAASGSYWELAGDRGLHTFADMRSRVGSNSAGLFVLGGEGSTARRRVLDPAIYRAATAQLERHFTLSIIDCGSTMDAPVTREVLGDVDALIVVSSPWYDGASAAGQTLEWLANCGYTAQLHRTVVVINDSDGHADKKELKQLAERFGKHGQKVIQLPYDQHLRPGGVIDVANELNPLTRRRLLELAAECAEHFAATADRPRGCR